MLHLALAILYVSVAGYWWVVLLRTTSKILIIFGMLTVIAYAMLFELETWLFVNDVFIIKQP